jgi:hypothetical protein
VILFIFPLCVQSHPPVVLLLSADVPLVVRFCRLPLVRVLFALLFFKCSTNLPPLPFGLFKKPESPPAVSLEFVCAEVFDPMKTPRRPVVRLCLACCRLVIGESISFSNNPPHVLPHGILGYLKKCE